jgi:hypothetical protein
MRNFIEKSIINIEFHLEKYPSNTRDFTLRKPEILSFVSLLFLLFLFIGLASYEMEVWGLILNCGGEDLSKKMYERFSGV